MDAVSVKPQSACQPRSTGHLSLRASVTHTTRYPSRMFNFSMTDIVGYLFNHSEMKGVNMDENLALPDNPNSLENDCAACCEHPNGKCSKHKHLETLRILKNPKTKDHSSIPRALNSFPAEVELCTSSIPGKRHGVRALQNIPEGTWIGPYEGKHIRPEDLTSDMDTSYMWEIFQDGKLVFYLDGSDENQSSWMRYICCARYKDEQNTSVMQYFGNIYYRVFKDIPPGEELLVWYDDSCPHYLGIPLKMQDIGASSTSKPRVVTTSEAITVPSITQGTTTKGTPPTTSTSQPKIISPLPPTHRQLEYPYPLPRQQVTLSGYAPYPPPNGYDVIIPSKISYNPDQLRMHDETYPKISLYSSYKNGPAKTIMTNCMNNKPFISHRAKPYSRDLPIDKSKTSYTRDLPADKSKTAYSRDVVIDHTKNTSNHIKAKTNDLDQNGNIENRLHDKEYYHHQRMIIDSTDRTINRFLSQIEEARNEQKMKQQQEQKQERNKEFNQSKEVDYELEQPEISIWKCGQCEKSFAQQQILQLHICSCIPEKPYKCTYCPEAFAQPSELRTHAVIHSGKKPFKCGFCSRLFAGSTTLNNHIRTHTGERPFGCEKCGRAFSQASQLSRHRRTMFECI